VLVALDVELSAEPLTVILNDAVDSAALAAGVPVDEALSSAAEAEMSML
jgi:hypothetical protein